MTSQVAQDLRAAAEVLRRDGWTQLTTHRPDGHCAAGAIEVAVDPDWATSDGWEPEHNVRFAAAIGALRKALGQQPQTFNDTPGRTADEVIAALEAAAAAAEAQQ